jgi:hypothetical protein
MIVTSFTIAPKIEEISTSIIYDNQEQAVSEGKEFGIKSFKFQWNGIDKKSISNIEEL